MISCLGQLCPRVGTGIFAPREFVISKGPGLMTSILPNNYSSVSKKICYKRVDFQLIFWAPLWKSFSNVQKTSLLSTKESI